MVQKAVQQLLFDVDWRESGHGPGLDVLIIDMPPGTGDVPLTLGQLVVLNGASYSSFLIPCFSSRTAIKQELSLYQLRRT